MAFFTRALIALFILAPSCTAYDSSFAYLDVSSPNSPKKTYCVNFQQFRRSLLPSAPDHEQETYTLDWWNGFNETEVCDESRKGFTRKEAVPLTYHTNPAETKCHMINVSIFMNFQMNIVKNADVAAVLFLVEKGKRNVYNIKDYLFSQFYNPNINDSRSPPVFYMYMTEFYDDLMPLIGHSKDVLMQFYRPQAWFLDLSIVVIWLIAVGCVGTGSVWAVKALDDSTLECYRRQPLPIDASVLQEEGSSNSTGETQEAVNSSHDEPTKNNTLMSCFEHCAYVSIAVAFVVGVLLLSFFFRDIAVWFFNIFLVLMGSICIHRCFYYVIRLYVEDIELFSLKDLQLCWSERDFCKKKFRLISLVVGIIALAICITWFFIRREYYAFYLLDFINVCLCLYAIKSSQIKSLRFITFLLVAMFVYDIVMVFGTRLLTPSGCSVMLQVVTGMDCRSAPKGETHPVAPIDMQFPEKIPLLFYVPMLSDPMSRCYDVEIETEYRHVMLGLGDVIVPGYLVAYCFFVDAILKKRFGYGPISLIGYGCGLIATFLALRLMQTAQPALIYLVPFTLVPVMITAFIHGLFNQIWLGRFY